MTLANRLLLTSDERIALWEQLAQTIEQYITQIPGAPVSPSLDPQVVRTFVAQFDFNSAQTPSAVVEKVVEGLWKHQVHTPHPRYFGLFNPAPTTMGIMADALVAVFNPQLAAWSHSPLAVEIERAVITQLGIRFGYDADSTDGTFTSGGAEANHTALLTALVHRFPDFAEKGVRALEGQPVFYVSAQSHHSFVKATRFCGLGTDAIRQIPTDSEFRMDMSALRAQIADDKQAGFIPFMVVGTAGTTSGGIIDPLAQIAQIAHSEGLWFHMDAAWGGFALIVPELRHLIAGSEQADSITFDAHKKLSVPMGAGIYLTRHTHILAETCRISTDYMPRDAVGLDEIIDPYGHSMQWSRRFIGLKVFLSLAVAGWDGYADALRHQVAMGDLLRQKLMTHGWRVVNNTPLPVVCFVDNQSENTFASLDAIAQTIVKSGEAWISTTRLDSHTPVLRACITNYRTSAHDIQALVESLNNTRQQVNNTI